MHKYWGKKPSDALRKYILKYTNKGDTVLDPFSGFGGIAIESLLLNRNVIINDLNPVACFISKCVLDENVKNPRKTYFNPFTLFHWRVI